MFFRTYNCCQFSMLINSDTDLFRFRDYKVILQGTSHHLALVRIKQEEVSRALSTWETSWIPEDQIVGGGGGGGKITDVLENQRLLPRGSAETTVISGRLKNHQNKGVDQWRVFVFWLRFRFSSSTFFLCWGHCGGFLLRKVQCIIHWPSHSQYKRIRFGKIVLF